MPRGQVHGDGAKLLSGRDTEGLRQRMSLFQSFGKGHLAAALQEYRFRMPDLQRLNDGFGFGLVLGSARCPLPAFGNQAQAEGLAGASFARRVAVQVNQRGLPAPCRKETVSQGGHGYLRDEKDAL